MREIGQKEARRAIWEGCKLALFVYTPMCGTCAAARRMLEVAEHLLSEGAVLQSNINYIPELVQDYRISSVPALLIYNGENEIPEIIYKMESVEHLLNRIRSVME
ncbi:thiol reductase thioredoxin [Paenibacillus kribbensis]|uniref:Thiol reductase thioredoxin n=1 Tax=Paenibacillus kribbensis TaxID=172713 RepID=A0A222WL80_9BACL|nr:thioredoxin family protein [Paenibacillus kribbensis]ASR47240.1 thiol reductase thioredoxin [Paenibacillus kribbensis]